MRLIDFPSKDGEVFFESSKLCSIEFNTLDTGERPYELRIWLDNFRWYAQEFEDPRKRYEAFAQLRTKLQDKRN